MHVIGHQTVGVKVVVVAPPVTAQTFPIRPVVSLIEKSLSSLVAPDNHVVEQAGSEQSGAARHEKSL